MNNKEFTEKYYIKRTNSRSIKWDSKDKKCIPMWIADMDFKDDERIINELKKFIEFGDYGYSQLPSDYYDVYIKWHQDRNKITYKKEWIRFTKGAVDAMYQIIYSLTNANDAILINTPLYPPFKKTIKQCKRKVIESKMINNDAYFTFNYKDIENKFKKYKVKMLMLCSPHNPVGRVFKKGELEELFELCHKYKVIVVADEVHSDIIMPDQEFLPALSFKKYQNDIISINAVSKTFSMAIFSHAHVLIANNKLMKKFDNYQNITHSVVNNFSALPSYYGYKYGKEWLDTCNNVIYENYKYLYKELSSKLQITPLEGSYLIFVNIGDYNKDKSASKYLADMCHVRVNAGETFDSQYNNWVRINLATSLSNIKKAVKAIKEIL